MKDRALSTLGLWVVVGLVIWVGGFFSVAEQAAFGLLALLVGAAQYEFHQLAARIPGVGRPSPTGIVAGFVLLFALFFLAEYANMILISALTAVFFLGGWLSPFEGLLGASHPLGEPGFHWLFAKLFFFLTCFMWYRATFPRYRYDQIMRLGWKVLIPVTLVWIVVLGVMVHLQVGPWAE